MSEVCPGSCEANPHNLKVIEPSTGNKLCDNPHCYFMVKYKDGTGAWQAGFEPTGPSVDFYKPTKEDEDDKTIK